jgi:hypothetical protein
MTNALIITLYGKLIKTTLELDIEIKKLQDKRGFLPDSLIAELADEHARRYACFIAQNDTGVYKFYTSAEVSTATLHKTAVQQWSRTIGKLHNVVKSNRGGARKTEPKVTPRKSKAVVDLLRQFNDLSAAERAAFLLDAK